jgi:hypothetical protein
MGKYGASTEVAAGRSRDELEQTLVRYGADGFGYGWDGLKAVITFRFEGTMVRFTIKMPNLKDDEFQLTPTGKGRSETQAYKAWEQAQRQRWRALNLVVKAKLEAVDSDITTFQEEFLAHILLPNGETVGDYTLPQLEQVRMSGKKMPKLLPGVK